MAEVNYIRHETNTKGRSYAEVARQMGVDRRTVKKYSDMEDFNPEKPIKQKRVSPVMDPNKVPGTQTTTLTETNMNTCTSMIK